MEESSREVSTPTDWSSKDPKDRGAMVKSAENEDLLNSSATMASHGQAQLLGQDRSEIQFAVKELACDMSAPTQHSWIKMKRVLRYLKGAPRAVLRYEAVLDQAMPKSLVVWSDSDFAGCVKSRISTSAGVIMFGMHTWKRSTNHAVISLSSAEAEYYALVKAGSVGLGLQAIAGEMRILLKGPVEMNSDASASVIVWDLGRSGSSR